MTTSPTARDAAETAKAVAADARDRIRAEGERAVDNARENAQTFAAERRDFASDYLGDVSDALVSAQNTLTDRGRTGAANLVHKAATEMNDLASRVHGQDVGRAISEVETFARNRPALFFGGAFALGFIVTRVLAGAGDPSRSPGYADPEARSPGHAKPEVRASAGPTAGVPQDNG